MPSRAALLAGVAAAAALLAIVSHSTGALDALENRTVDGRFGVRGTQTADPGIVIVGLDQKTVAELNERPPIARHHHADLLDRLHAGQPRLVGFDVHFAGATEPREDAALVEAIGRDGPVLLVTEDLGDSYVPVPAGKRDAPGAVISTGAVPNDGDNVVRKMLYAPVRLKTFAVRAAELVRGGSVSEDDFEDNEAWIDFRGPPGTFRTVSYVDVLEGRVPASTFRGKVVLVGETDPTGKDVFVTSASDRPMAGVEIHANALSTILRGFPLKETGGVIDAVLILLLAGLPAAAALRLSSPFVLAAAAGAALLLGVLAQLLFNGGRIVPFVDPLLALIAATVGAVAVEVLVERRKRETLEATMPSEASEFFISYRRDQSSWPARILKTELAKRFGETSVFMDLDSIAAGQEWPQRIQEALRGSTVVLVLIGPYWLDAKDGDGRPRLGDPGDWVRLEIETALDEPGVAVVPVLLDGAAMPDEHLLPESLRPLARRNAITLTPDGWGDEIDDLVESIRKGRLQEYFAQRRAAGAA